MVNINIQLKDITDIKQFVSTVSKYNEAMDLGTGRYIVDAKSILGVLTLPLGRPLCLDINADDDDVIGEDIKRFAI